MYCIWAAESASEQRRGCRRPGVAGVPDVLRRVSERDIVFGLAFQYTAFAQQRIEPAQHFGIAPQSAAIVVNGFGSEYGIEQRRLAGHLRGKPAAPQQLGKRAHQLPAGAKNVLVGTRPPE